MPPRRDRGRGPVGIEHRARAASTRAVSVGTRTAAASRSLTTDRARPMSPTPAQRRTRSTPSSWRARSTPVAAKRSHVRANTSRELEAALAAFGVDVRGRVAADLGASTGGFTLVLVEAGAARAYAVDAGHGQLLGSLRAHPRVVSLERVNVARLGDGVVARRH